MKQTLLLSAVTIGLLFTACKKNNTSQPPGVSYQLKATNTSYAVAKTTALANIVWTSGFATPDVIKFEAKQANVKVEYKSTNNAQIDLMAPNAITFGNFTLPAGTYDEIELKIDLDKSGTTPTLQLDGTFTSGAITLPVEILVNESVELKTEQKNVTITNDYNFTAITTLDLQMISSGITSTMLLNAELTNGTIIISSTSNHALYNIIRDNLGNEHHHCEFEHHHK